MEVGEEKYPRESFRAQQRFLSTLGGRFKFFDHQAAIFISHILHAL
jgi:hypothetical protein